MVQGTLTATAARSRCAISKPTGEGAGSWAEVQADFASASTVHNCVVFNIGGNKYRLATRIVYPSQKIFVLTVMTHEEYDEGKWKEQCRGFGPATTRRTISVSIIGDRKREPNEAFSVRLSNPVGATIADGVATGTVLNDD